MHREGPRVGPRKAPESSPLQGARLHWQRGAPRGARPGPWRGAAAACNGPGGVVQWAMWGGRGRRCGGRGPRGRRRRPEMGYVHRAAPRGRMVLQPSRL